MKSSITVAFCWLADVTEAFPDEIAKYTNSDSEWRLDNDQAVAAENDAHICDKVDNSACDVIEGVDEGTNTWAENVASGGCEAGASGWDSNGFKNIDADSQWNNTSTVNDLLNDRHSHWFTASVVVNTGDPQRCELQQYSTNMISWYYYAVDCSVWPLWLLIR